MSPTPNSPRCSVIIPMDRPGADALRAVASVLAQGPRLRELIVGAASRVELPADPRVRLLVVEERNPALRRNKAAAEAKGEPRCWAPTSRRWNSRPRAASATGSPSAGGRSAKTPRPCAPS